MSHAALSGCMLVLLLGACRFAVAQTFEVGPNKPYASIAAVPWAALNAGDLVLIHWRSTAYKEKWVIARRGTSTAPITIRGVASSTGALPVIDGNMALTPQNLNFWSEARGVIKVGGANVPSLNSSYIVIENLEIRGGRPPYTYRGFDGRTYTYSSSAASIYIETGENITVRNCILRDSANGLFCAYQTRNLLVEACYLFDNGIESSSLQHNSYTEANGASFQFNHYGPLRANCRGSNLKDRSAASVVRYNWIEGANRQLELVESDYAEIYNLSSYRSTFVYGNVLIENAADGNSQIVHYGGDNGNTVEYRKGMLYFYNNTIFSRRTDHTTLLRLSSSSERADVRNNIFYTVSSGSNLAILDSSGTVDLRNNWIKSGWTPSFSGSVAVNNAGGNISGTSPAFSSEANQDYRLTSSSPCLNGATALHASAASTHPLSRQYLKHQNSEPRASVTELGAFELATTAQVLTGITLTPATATILLGQNQQFLATARDQAGMPMNAQPLFTWSVSGGGSVSSSGLFSSTAAGGPFSVSASGGGKSATAQITVAVSTSALPSPWQTADVGNTGAAGRANYANATFTVEGAGADIWNNADAFRFVYQSMNGDGQIVARLSSLEQTHEYAKAGVMMRESLQAGSRHAFAALTGDGFVGFLRRAASGGSSTGSYGRKAGTPCWLKVVRQGEVFSAYESSSGTSWTLIDSASIPMNSTLYVGLAVTSHVSGTLNTALFTNVSTSSGSSGGTPGAPITLQAEDYVAYYDTTPGNDGGAYRSDGVDIEKCYDTGGGYHVAYTRAGEWLAYNLSLPASGTFDLALRVASPYDQKRLRLQLDGATVGSTVIVPNTGAWQAWTVISVATGFPVSAGSHTLKLIFDDGSANLNWISLTPASTTLLGFEDSVVPDSDDDGLLDEYEALTGLDPAVGDSDGNGVSDADEFCSEQGMAHGKAQALHLRRHDLPEDWQPCPSDADDAQY